ncbi:guanylate kinase isoform X1 [Dendroctonus ponderosae]|nr:guanylate kinase isoform X1 [Dendroctonus ponderosae]
MSSLHVLKRNWLFYKVSSFCPNQLDHFHFRTALRTDFSTMHPKLPRPLVFCGPSGSGKSTLVKRLIDDFPEKFGFTVSHTTRSPRPGEKHGQHYYFIDESDMKTAIANGDFIEHAVFSGNIYGTSFRAVEDIAKQGKIVLMDIDMQGVKQIKQTTLNPWCVFIHPPSLPELKERLLKRKTESEESLARRLAKAREEIKFGLTPNFDKTLVNDDLDKTYKELKKFVEENILEIRIPTV